MSLPQPGDRFARNYRIESALGPGPIGTLFLAKGPSRIVVELEVLDPAQPDVAARHSDLGKVAHAIEKLRHPSIPALVELGVSDEGEPFIARMHADGPTLDTLIAAGRSFTEPQTIAVLFQLLGALEEAHGRSTLHGMLRPACVHVVEERAEGIGIAVRDFGLAKTRAHAQSPRYAAPEQLRGWNLSATSDLYCVGLIAYEMLWGALPTPPGAPVAVPPAGVSPQLHAFLSALLATEMPERYSSATAALTSLRAIAAPLRGSHGAGRSRQWRVPAAVALLVVGAAVAWFVTQRRAAQPKPDADIGAAVVDAGALDVGAAEVGPSGRGDSGCGKPPKILGFGELRGLAAIDEEVFGVYLPRGYDAEKEHPAIVILGNDTSRFTPTTTDLEPFQRVADRHGVVLLSPRVTWSPSSSHGPLVGRVNDVVRFADDQLCLDRARIYVVGFTHSFGLAQAMQCEVWVAGIATLNEGATWEPPKSVDCPDRIVPFIAFENALSRRHCVESLMDCKDTSKSFTDVRMKAHNHCGGGSKEHSVSPLGSCRAWTCAVPYERCAVKTRDYFGQFDAANRIWKFFDNAPRE